jgi:hypothetical protein
MPTFLRSEKIPSSGKEYRIHGEEDAPIRPIDPKILRRATLKIDFYLIPIVGMFCELYILSHPCASFIPPIPRSIVFSSEYSCDPTLVIIQTVAQPTAG